MLCYIYVIVYLKKKFCFSKPVVRYKNLLPVRSKVDKCPVIRIFQRLIGNRRIRDARESRPINQNDGGNKPPGSVSIGHGSVFGIVFRVVKHAAEPKEMWLCSCQSAVMIVRSPFSATLDSQERRFSTPPASVANQITFRIAEV